MSEVGEASTPSDVGDGDRTVELLMFRVAGERPVLGDKDGCWSIPWAVGSVGVIEVVITVDGDSGFQKTEDVKEGIYDRVVDERSGVSIMVPSRGAIHGFPRAEM